MLTLHLHCLGDGLSVCHLRHSEGNLHAKLGLHLGNRHIEVLLTETGNNHFVGLVVLLELECRVFFANSLNRAGSLGFVALLHNFNRSGNKRCGHFYAREHIALVGSGEGVACHKGIKLCHRADITGGDAGCIFLFRASHRHNLAESFALLCSGIVAGSLGRDFTGNDLEEGKLADKGVCDGLEDNRCKRTVFVTLNGNLVAVLIGRGFLCSGSCREEVHDTGHEHIDGSGGKTVASIDRISDVIEHCLLEASADFLGGEVFTLEEFFHQLVISGSHCFFECFHQLFILIKLGERNFRGLIIRTVLNCLVGNEVCIAGDFAVIIIHRHHSGANLAAVLRLKRVQCLVEIGVFSLTLGDGEGAAGASLAGNLKRLLGTDA